MNQMASANVTRPVMRYHGGKWRLAPWIISHFPAHRIYVEPFGGAGSVLMRKKLSALEVYNDLDGEIVNVFRVLRDPEQAERLAHLLTLTPHARAEYDLSCEPADCPVEQARRTLTRAYMGFGNGTTAQYKTGFRNKHKPQEGSLPVSWASYPSQIQQFAGRLRHVTVEHIDAFECIEKYDSPSTLFYVDPPYLPETRTALAHGKCYRHELTTEQHRELAGVLHSVRGMVVLSGYDSPLYRDLYAGWQVAACAARAEKASPRIEVLWMSPRVQRLASQRMLNEML